jgi:alpha-tubulin suppressor-like RCC1 family protein
MSFISTSSKLPGGSRYLTLLLFIVFFIYEVQAQRPVIVLGWGSASGGRLGRPALASSSGFPLAAPPGLVNLAQVSGHGNPPIIVKVAGGADFGLAITANDRILVWGNNDFDQLAFSGNQQPTPDFLPRNNVPKTDLIVAGRTVFSIQAQFKPYHKQQGNGSKKSVEDENPIQLLDDQFSEVQDQYHSGQHVKISSRNVLEATSRPSDNTFLYGWGQIVPLSSSFSLLPPRVNPNGNAKGEPLPIAPSPSAAPFSQVKAMSCSMVHCVVLNATSSLSTSVFGWGDNTAHRLSCPSLTSGTVCAMDSIVESLKPGSQIIDISVSNTHTVLLTDTSDLIVMGRHLHFTSADSTSPLEPLLVPQSSLPEKCRKDLEPQHFGVRSMASGLDFTLILCNGTVFGFGNNSIGQLGRSTPEYAEVESMIEILSSPIGFSAEDDEDDESGPAIKMIAASRTTGYALAKNGTVYGWGGTQDMALGSDIPNPSSQPIALPLVSANLANFTVLDISAHMSSHGAFARIGERIGLGSCPKRPRGFETAFCSSQGFWTFQPTFIRNGTVSLDQGTVMSGDISVSDTATIEIKRGARLLGSIELRNKSKLFMTTSTSKLEGDLVLLDESEFVLDEGALVLNGTLRLADAASVVISNSTFDKNGTHDPLITVEGEAVINGTIYIAVAASVLQELLEEGRNGSVTDASRTSKILATETSGGRAIADTVVITLQTPVYDSCQTVTNTLDSSGTSISVLLTLDSSACISSGPVDPTSPTAQILKKNNKMAIIVGVTVGAVVVVTVIAAIIILSVPAIKHAVLPYRRS